MNSSDLEDLIEKYLNNTITSIEKMELLEWYRQKNEEPIDWVSDDVDESNIVKERVFTEIKAEIGRQNGKNKPNSWYRIAIAASILLVGSVFTYVYKGTIVHPEIIYELPTANEVLPGGNNAVLTLADGSEIILNDQHTGLIAKEGNTLVNKALDGKIVYSSETNNISNISSINTITVPKGGQYQIVLPDGSKVWLNASSSLRFPTVFTGKERNVTLIGEGYFEIAKKEGMPFKVSANNTEVEVMGTHFNINAYQDEKAVKTTLLEGKVRVFRGNAFKVLKPGQQANVVSDEENQSITVENVDAGQVIAWKEGMFVFNNTDLDNIMRQLERWYDVKIEGKIPNEQFNGIINRNSTLSEVLKMMELTSNLHFKIEERRVIMLP